MVQSSRDPFFCFVVSVMLRCSLLPPLTSASLPVYPLDTAAVRQVVEAAMRCQSVRQFHAAVVHRDRELLKLQLELQPDGQTKELDGSLMFLGSLSKGMFGTGLVRVEQHLRAVLKNDSFSLFTTPIKQLLQDRNFWFLDPIRSELVTIDDLISHRTGLARHDWMWYMRDWNTLEEMVRNVGRLEATADFRNSFVYNNLAWTVADVVVQNLTNRTFVEYMREFLWHPLGMRNTHGSSEITDNLPGVPQNLTSVDRSTRFVEAAGGILSALSDVMKYMKLHVATHNYSAYQPVPEQFLSLNPMIAKVNFNKYLDRELYNQSVTNFSDPLDWEIDSYTRGWMKTMYRDQLDYYHSAGLIGSQCELDVFIKQNLAVFNHMTLSSPVMSSYPIIMNKYISDLLLTNQSHVTKDNVCSLFKVNNDTDVAKLPRRHLEENEVTTLSGSYGNYGFGKVQVIYNQTLQSMTLHYGFAVVELIPVVLVPGEKEPYKFYPIIHHPVEFSSSSSVLNRTDDAITVPASTAQSFVSVSRDARDNLVLEGSAIESGMKLTKDLEPSSWKRPCDPEEIFGMSGWGLGLGTSAVAVGFYIVLTR